MSTTRARYRYRSETADRLTVGDLIELLDEGLLHHAPTVEESLAVLRLAEAAMSALQSSPEWKAGGREDYRAAASAEIAQRLSIDLAVAADDLGLHADRISANCPIPF
jgi:hypothetical protein